MSFENITVTLKQIGAYIARQQFNDAVDVLINGDGNANPAPVIDCETGTALKYTDLLNLIEALDPYNMSAVVASPGMVMDILNIDEFKNPLTGINFAGTGKVGKPLGAKLLKSSAVEPGRLIGLDSSCALEMVVASDVEVDYDKLIDRQLERAAITTTAGFAKIFNEASVVLNI